MEDISKQYENELSEALTAAKAVLPEDIWERLAEIVSGGEDPEPYRDGTYGQMPDVAAKSVQDFTDFTLLMMADGYSAPSPGRGYDDLGIQFIEGKTNLVLNFESNGVILVAVLDFPGGTDNRDSFSCQSPAQAFTRVGPIMERMGLEKTSTVPSSSPSPR